MLLKIKMFTRIKSGYMFKQEKNSLKDGMLLRNIRQVNHENYTVLFYEEDLIKDHKYFFYI